jgi:hypothetical protein
MKKLEYLRSLELIQILKIYYVWICLSLLTDSLPTVQPILIFYTYSKLGNTLTYAKAFTTLTLFYLIQGPLGQIPNIFTSGSALALNTMHIMYMYIICILNIYI